MIITKIKAGLGNQLFQYACGRALSLRNNDILKLDLTVWDQFEDFRTFKGAWMTEDGYLDPYSLQHFNIVENIASHDEIQQLKYPRGRLSSLYFKIRTKLGLFNVSFVPRILKKKGDQYLDGYWQTEKYFRDHAATIRNELTLKKPMSSEAQDLLKEIQSKKISIAIHVRRGTITKAGSTHLFFGICSNSYYERAIDLILKKINGGAHIFVFSDSINLVKDEISIKYPVTYVTPKMMTDYEELILMSMCNHNVIANSSFSWWGAWLNSHPDKIVIAPRRWTKEKNYIYRDIIPKSWLRI